MIRRSAKTLSGDSRKNKKTMGYNPLLFTLSMFALVASLIFAVFSDDTITIDGYTFNTTGLAATEFVNLFGL